MTELKPGELRNLLAKFKYGCGWDWITPKESREEIDGLVNAIRPQSLTEKVKIDWPKVWDSLEEILSQEVIEGVGVVKSRKYVEMLVDKQLRKQSLNQASQEDREGLDKLINEVIGDVVGYYKDEEGLFDKIADAILKEYILVRREK